MNAFRIKISALVILASALVSAHASDQTLFTTQTPKGLINSDGANVNYELGMKFKSTVSGQVTAIRFYKSPSETGTHTGHIYSATGKQLAAVQFATETGSGWQQAALSNPVAITKGSQYVVSVNTGGTYYVDTISGLASLISNGNLRSIVGNNGVFGPVGKMPTGSWNNSNYFRDVVFTTGTVTPPPPTPTPVPPPPPTTTGYPDSTNTGVPAGVTLKPSGGITVTTNGAVIDAMDFNGSVNIDADDVTLKRSRIVAGGYWAVNILPNHKNVTVEDCYIDNGTGGGEGIQIQEQTNLQLLRNEIVHGADGISIGGAQTALIQDNYIHDLRGTPDSHFDGVQTDSVHNLTFRHNTIINQYDQTSAIMLGTDWGSYDGVVIDNNRLSGGDYTIYAASGGAGTGNNVQVTNNRLGTGQYGYLVREATNITASGNVDDVSGKPINP